jgi:acyl dehydratase
VGIIDPPETGRCVSNLLKGIGLASSLETKMNLGSWTITQESVRQYLNAVGDTLPLYAETGLAPPLALAAYSLRALLQKLNLPPGAIHSLQELETLRVVRFGEEITGIAHLERPRSRREMQFITVRYTLLDRDGQKVLTGKSTVLVTLPMSSA